MWTKTPIKQNHVMHFGRRTVAHTGSGATSPTQSAPAKARIRRSRAWEGIGKLPTP